MTIGLGALAVVVVLMIGFSGPEGAGLFDLGPDLEALVFEEADQVLGDVFLRFGMWP